MEENNILKFPIGGYLPIWLYSSFPLVPRGPGIPQDRQGVSPLPSINRRHASHAGDVIACALPSTEMGRLASRLLQPRS